MEKDLFLLLLALIISAVGRIDLLWSVAVIEITDRLIRLIVHSYLLMKRSQQRKCPSSSAKRDGRLRKRS